MPSYLMIDHLSHHLFLQQVPETPIEKLKVRMLKRVHMDSCRSYAECKERLQLSFAECKELLDDPADIENSFGSVQKVYKRFKAWQSQNPYDTLLDNYNARETDIKLLAWAGVCPHSTIKEYGEDETAVAGCGLRDNKGNPGERDLKDACKLLQTAHSSIKSDLEETYKLLKSACSDIKSVENKVHSNFENIRELKELVEKNAAPSESIFMKVFVTVFAALFFLAFAGSKADFSWNRDERMKIVVEPLFLGCTVVFSHWIFNQEGKIIAIFAAVSFVFWSESKKDTLHHDDTVVISVLSGLVDEALLLIEDACKFIARLVLVFLSFSTTTKLY